MVVTVEHMQKVSQDEAKKLKVSMGAEWKSIAVAADAQAFPSPLSAKGQPYWSEERAAKLRRLQSEPTSPPPRKLDFGSQARLCQPHAGREADRIGLHL